MTVAVAAPVRGRPSKEAIAQLELVARRQEAGQFTAAITHVVRQLESILLRPYVEVPPEALQLTLQLRAMGDRYARRWEPES